MSDALQPVTIDLTGSNGSEESSGEIECFDFYAPAKTAAESDAYFHNHCDSDAYESFPHGSSSIKTKAFQHPSAGDACFEDCFFPSIHELFLLYNDLYFYGSLGCVVVEWSKRMTQCAGLCIYKGKGNVTIRLSAKLLELRPFSDTINTLLHEMIHAFLFLTKGPQGHDRDGHGNDFCMHMQRINALANSQVTIYHSFHDEVDYFRQHVWRCDGACQHRPPFYGLVKRVANRAPSPADFWWRRHAASCSGTFHKIAAPPPRPRPVSSPPPPKSLQNPRNQQKISDFFIQSHRLHSDACGL